MREKKFAPRGWSKVKNKERGGGGGGGGGGGLKITGFF